jgi:hypothetical protein
MASNDGFDNVPTVGQNLNSSVSGIFSAKPTAKYASGARCVLKINGKISAFAFAVSWRINTTVTEILTIDDYFPAELAPQRISVEGTISALHIPGTNPGTELWQADALHFLFQQYIDIEVRDSATNELLFHTNRAIVTSRQEDMRVDALSNVQLTWKAIGFQDERKPELPDSKSPPDTATTKSPSVAQKAFDSVKNLF